MKNGFTLLELLLVIALVALIAGLSIPFYSNFIVRNYLNTSSSSLVQTVEKAQNYAKSGKQDATWGVYMTSSDYTLYKGTSYAARDTNLDELYTFPSGIAHGGLTEIHFDHLRGETTNTGVITLTATNGASTTIQINSSGIESIN